MLCSHARRLKYFPLVWQPIGQFASLILRYVGQQLREIQLRVYSVPTACACQAGQDRRSSTTRVSLVLNARYNAVRTTIITTNYPVVPPGAGGMREETPRERYLKPILFESVPGGNVVE